MAKCEGRSPKMRLPAKEHSESWPTALHVLAYNLTRVMNIIGRRGLIAAIKAA